MKPLVGLLVAALAVAGAAQTPGTKVRVVLRTGEAVEGTVKTQGRGLLVLEGAKGPVILREDEIREVQEGPKAAPAAPAAPPAPPARKPGATPAQIEAARRALRSPILEMRAVAEALLETNREDAWAALLPDLEAKEREVRLAAARILGRVVKPEVKRALARALRADPDEGVRRLAAMGLRVQDPAGLRDAYCDAYEREESVAVRKSLLISANALKDPEFFPRLVDLLAREENDYLKKFLLQSLRSTTGGLDFGDDVDAWKEWWRTRKEDGSSVEALKRSSGGEEQKDG